jgi:hypothetical protein
VASLQAKIRANAAPHLRPGEEIQAVIPAQTLSGYLMFFGLIFSFLNGYRVIIATDQRVMLCRSGRNTLAPVRGVLRELPRQTVIGPAHGLWYRPQSIGEKLYIHRRFFADVAAADAALPEHASSW